MRAARLTATLTPDARRVARARPDRGVRPRRLARAARARSAWAPSSRSPPTWRCSSARRGCWPAWWSPAQLARAGVERVYELIDSQPDVERRPDAIDVPDGPLGVELDDVQLRLRAQRTGARRGLAARSRPARRSRWSARRARASRRSRCCCPGSTRCTGRVRRPLGAPSTCGELGWPPCAAPWAWCSRRRSCSPTRSGPTSPTDARTPPTSRCAAAARAAEARRVHLRAAAGLRHPGRRARPDAVRRPTPARSRWPGRCCPTRACSCSTTPRPRLTPPPRRPSTPPCVGSPPQRTTLAHRAPPLHARAGRPDRGARRRPGRRRRHRSGAHQPLRAVPCAARRPRRGDRRASRRRIDVRRGPGPDGITPQLWPGAPRRPQDASDGTTAQTRPARCAAALWPQLGGIRPTPELLAAVAALPPATAQPDLHGADPTAPDPDFRLRRLLRPVRWRWLPHRDPGGGSTRWRPWRSRRWAASAVDDGITAACARLLGIAVAVGLGVVAVRLGRIAAADRDHRPCRRDAALPAAGAQLRAPAAARPRLLRARARPAGS